MLYSEPTKDFHIYIIKDQFKMIGRLNTKLEGAFIIYTSKTYHDSFGVNKELLFDDRYRFKYVIVHHNNSYYTTRQKIIDEGFEKTFDFGTKIFLPINKWDSNKKNSEQLSFDF